MGTNLVMILARSRRRHDEIWVMVDRLIKPAYFLAIKAKSSSKSLVDLYISEIGMSLEILKFIVSYWDPRFTFRF